MQLVATLLIIAPGILAFRPVHQPVSSTHVTTPETVLPAAALPSAWDWRQVNGTNWLGKERPLPKLLPHPKTNIHAHTTPLALSSVCTGIRWGAYRHPPALAFRHPQHRANHAPCPTATRALVPIRGCLSCDASAPPGVAVCSAHLPPSLSLSLCASPSSPTPRCSPQAPSATTTRPAAAPVAGRSPQPRRSPIASGSTPRAASTSFYRRRTWCVAVGCRVVEVLEIHGPEWSLMPVPVPRRSGLSVYGKKRGGGGGKGRG